MSEPSQPVGGARRPPPLAWEAYVAGHHGPMFGAWLDAAFEEAGLGLPPRTGAAARCPGMGEMNRALRGLAVAGAVRGPVLVEVHRALDAVGAWSRRLRRHWQAADPARIRHAAVRGLRRVDVLLELSESLLTPTTGVASWFRLGAAVGRCRRECRNAATSGDYPADLFDDVRAALVPLRGAPGDDLLQPVEVVTRVERGPERDVLAEARHARLANLKLAAADVAVQCGLRGVSAPRPLLLLDAERVVVFGRESRLPDLGRPQAAVLWLLAENAGRPVSRTALRRAGRIQTPEPRMEEVVSRLRDRLATTLDDGNTERRHHRQALRELIRGMKGDYPHEGPYILDLAPEFVRVVPPRPGWMQQT